MTDLRLAAEGVFWTIQGEGHLAGCPMAFVRLAGCDVGCAGCDTDYRFVESVASDEVVERVLKVTPDSVVSPWAWITGGEPTLQSIAPLCRALQARGYRVAVASAGERPLTPPVEWVSLSPHRPGRLRQRFGHELKIVPGLHTESDLDALRAEAETADVWFRYVQPLAGDIDSLEKCLAFINDNPNWCLSEQHHKRWRVP